MNCSTCGFYLPRDTCRDDIRDELTKADLDGVCGEASQGVFQLPYIPRAEYRKCGKHITYQSSSTKNGERT